MRFFYSYYFFWGGGWGWGWGRDERRGYIPWVRRGCSYSRCHRSPGAGRRLRPPSASAWEAWWRTSHLIPAQRSPPACGSDQSALKVAEGRSNHQVRARRAIMMINDVQLRTRRSQSLYKVYGCSALLVLNGTSLISVNALLALSWQNVKLSLWRRTTFCK